MDFSFTQQGTLLNVPSCSQDRNLAHTALSTSKMSHFGARGRRCAIIWDGYTERKVSPRLSFQNTYIYVFIHTYILKCIWEMDYSFSKLITFLESSSAQFALPGFSVSLSLPSLYHSLTYWERIEIIFLTGFSKNIYMMQGASTRILQPVIQVYQSGQ